MSTGWISIHRKLQDNPLWSSEPFTRGQAWVDLILLANHEPGYIYVRDHKINLERGDVGWSQNKLSQRWKWSRTKVRNFLNDLEKEQQLKQIKSHSYTVIRLINYNEYQDIKHKKTTVVQQKDNSSTTGVQQKDTNNNVNNENNVNNNYVQYVDFWNECNDCNLRITDKKRTQIKARLNTYTEEELKRAIEKRANDEWINGEGKKFKANWDSFWRNDEKAEWYLNKENNNSQKVFGGGTW